MGLGVKFSREWVKVEQYAGCGLYRILPLSHPGLDKAPEVPGSQNRTTNCPPLIAAHSQRRSVAATIDNSYEKSGSTQPAVVILAAH